MIYARGVKDLLCNPRYDSFFQEYILNQGMSYLYGSGAQIAARDPVQHALPLIELGRSDLVKSVLRYTLSEMQPSFYTFDPTGRQPSNIPYGETGFGILPKPSTSLMPDDMELYVLFLASEYLLATKDKNFLQEKVRFYATNRSHTVLEALARCAHFTIGEAGAGEHGLIRLLTSDWDDSFHPPAQSENVSESVLTASLATYTLDRAAAMFEWAGDSTTSHKASAFAEQNRKAILTTAFNGEWLRRAWFGSEGWVGDLPEKNGSFPGMFSAQHGWALMGGVFDAAPGPLQKVLANLRGRCREGWNYGFPYYCDLPREGHPFPEGVPAAEGEARRRLQSSGTGEMWAAINHPTILGLLHANQSSLAWQEFVLNSMRHQANTSGHVWVGIWTAADQHHNGGGPGWIESFPALCMHRHAWPLVSLRHFAGIHFTADGLLIRPGLPSHLGAFDYNTALASVAWDGKETWKGRFALEHGRRSLRLVLDLSLAIGDVGSSTISLERTDTHADSTTQERWQVVTRADGAAAAHLLVADAATVERPTLVAVEFVARVRTSGRM